MRRIIIAIITAIVLPLTLVACSSDASPKPTSTAQITESGDSISYLYTYTMPDGYKMLCVWGGLGNGGPSCDWVGYHLHIGDLPSSPK
ncbi:MAG: hypothetical protein ABIP74_05050 [Candidatus Saccharimonas sp.]